jgi:hypothetical protein
VNALRLFFMAHAPDPLVYELFRVLGLPNHKLSRPKSGCSTAAMRSTFRSVSPGTPGRDTTELHRF